MKPDHNGLQLRAQNGDPSQMEFSNAVCTLDVRHYFFFRFTLPGRVETKKQQTFHVSLSECDVMYVILCGLFL
jgi:hypothetical protein